MSDHIDRFVYDPRSIRKRSLRRQSDRPASVPGIGTSTTQVQVNDDGLASSEYRGLSDLPSDVPKLPVTTDLGTLVLMWGLGIGLTGGFIYTHLLKGAI